MTLKCWVVAIAKFSRTINATNIKDHNRKRVSPILLAFVNRPVVVSLDLHKTLIQPRLVMESHNLLVIFLVIVSFKFVKSVKTRSANIMTNKDVLMIAKLMKVTNVLIMELPLYLKF